MPDPFGLSEGVKGLSSSLDSSREAANQLSKSIEGVQQDATDVAQRKAQERRRACRGKLWTSGLRPAAEWENAGDWRQMAGGH